MRSGIIRNLFKKYPAVWKVALTALGVTIVIFVYVKAVQADETIQSLGISNERLLDDNIQLGIQAKEIISVNEELSLNTEKMVNKLEKQEEEFALIADTNALLKQAIEKRDAEMKRINLSHQKELSLLRNEITKLKNKPEPVVSRGTRSSPSKGKTIQVSATAYTAFCNGCSGITATGINLRANPGLKVVAVDPNIIPLGSKVWVEGYGYAIAGDTGSAIKGNKIDLFMPSRSNALKWGRKTVSIKILK